MQRITGITMAVLLCAVGALRAQYSQQVFELKKAQSQYDENGFTNGKAIDVDGNLVVNPSNGSVAYSYPVSHQVIGGYPFDVALNYASSVSFTAFKDYNLADRQTGSLYSGWARFHQQRPLWILSANNWAIDVIATSTHFHCDSASRAFNGLMNAFDDRDFIWTIDGFDWGNRMIDFNPVAAARGNKVTDMIQILRGDGSVLKLYNANTQTPNDSNPDMRPELYTGYYHTNSANDRSYAVVDYADNWFPACVKNYLVTLVQKNHEPPVTPRRVRYYPGDGSEYVFREWPMPFGYNAFIDDENRSGGIWGGPTVFYLEEMRSSAGQLVDFTRARHYPDIGSPLYGIEDKTRGRALITEFADHRISFGSNALIIEALGRTTKVRFDTIARSGNAASWETMPYASAGTLSSRTAWLAGLPEGNPELYKSFIGYVTKITDAADRVTTFDYEPIVRTYEDYNFPHGNPGTGHQTVALKNYRLKSISEPDATYTLRYKTPLAAGNIIAGATNEPAKLNDVCDSVKKYGPDGVMLTETKYTSDINSAYTTVRDAATGQSTTTILSYETMDLGSVDLLMPPEHHTYISRTDVIGGGDTVVTTTTYAQGTGIPGVGTNTPFLVLPVNSTAIVNGVHKSYTTFSYSTDTLRRFGGRADLAGKYGIEVTRKSTEIKRPDDHTTVLFSDTTEYAHYRQLDTSLTWLEYGWNKFASLANWHAFRAADSACVRGKRWEEVMYAPPVAVYEQDTMSADLSLPPLFGAERASWRSNAVGRIAGTRAVLNDAVLARLNRTERGMTLRDSILGAGNAAVLKASYRYANGWRRLLEEQRNALGAALRYSYNHDWCGIDTFGVGGCESGPHPLGLVLSNDDTVRGASLEPGAFGVWYATPAATRTYVRRYDPATLALKTDTLAAYNELTYYGLTAATRDANGWLQRAAYDRDGRLAMLWSPGDFPRLGALDTVRYTGSEAIELYGDTYYQRRADSVHCQKIDGKATSTIVTGPVFETATYDTLWAHLPLTQAPPCPCKDDPAEAKLPGRSLMATCDQMLPYPVHTGYRGVYGVLPCVIDSASALHTARRIDSLMLETVITSIDGECVHLEVQIDSVFSTTFVLNCAAGEEGGDGGAETKEGKNARTLAGAGSITPIDGGYKLRVNLSSAKAALAARPLWGVINVRLLVKTADGTIAFASGTASQDMRPKFLVYGEFERVSERSDYTLAFDHDDANLTTTMRAKVDDSRHTANRQDPAHPWMGLARRSTATYTHGADGRLLATDAAIIEDNGPARTDHASAFYNGLGRAVTGIDVEGDTVRTTYDALGRVTETTTADGSKVRVSYRIAPPDSFGITVAGPAGQDFYGFCSATVTTNEDGVKFASYADAFGRVRREVSDSAGLRLTTRYEYDAAGRLALAINPKGDTTAYYYDGWGNIREKHQPDLGSITYAFDKLRNVRYVQTEDQWYKGKLGFNQYDDLNRIVLVGEAIIGENPHRATVEDDGWDDPASWLHGHARSPEGIYGAEEKKDTRRSMQGGPSLRTTDLLDASKLAIGVKWDSTMTVTANVTVWQNPITPTPTFWAPAQSAKQSICTLPVNAMLQESETPKGPYLRHPVGHYASPSTPYASLTDFEDAAVYPHFVRIAINYDTLPARQGSIWAGLPSHTQWNALMPKGKVRNLKGHEAVVAYREHGGEPYHYAAMSYDERGRVEALVRYTENLGFDAVYYAYNSANLVTSVRVVDYHRTFQTWYGYDAQGRMDSVWTSISAINAGLVPGPFTGNTWSFRPSLPRPDKADIVYRYTRGGQVDTMTYPKINVLMDYAYNHRKWLDSMVATKGGSPLWKQALTYDPAGQIMTQLSDHVVAPATTQTYGYDAMQRLGTWAMPGLVERYGYDAVGNRVSTQTVTPLQADNMAYAFGGAAGGSNRLAAATLTDTTGVITRSTNTFAYDRNGATVMKRVVDANPAASYRQEYAYSYRGLARRFGVGTLTTMGQDWRYRYSAAGEREQKRLYWQGANDTVSPYPWVYYLLGGHGEQLAVYHGQQTAGTQCGDTGRRVYMYPVEYLTHGVSGTANLITSPTLTKKYVIADHLGSARVMLDSGGVVIERLDYQPFGEAIPIAGAVAGVRKNYIDKERDAESGAMNLGVRGMEDARFLSIDPLWEKYRGHSPYAYSANNPLRLVDRDGREFTFYKVNDDGSYRLGEDGKPIVDTDLKRAYERTVRYMEERGVAEAAQLRYLETEKGFTVNMVSGVFWTENRFRGGKDKNGSDGTLIWGQTAGMSYEAIDEDLHPVVQYLGPAEALIHEGNHAFRFFKNREQYDRDVNTQDPDYQDADEREAVKAEFSAGKTLHHLQYIRPDHTNYIDLYNTVYPWTHRPQTPIPER